MSVSGHPARTDRRSGGYPAAGVRVVGYREDGRTMAGGLTPGGEVVPIADVEAFWNDPEAAMASMPGSGGTARPVEALELVPPVRPAARVLCVGLNYRDHAAEGPFEVPDHPAIFARWTASLNVSGGTVAVPPGEPGLDWEGELLAVVGRRLHRADEETALAGVFGYAPFNDITARRAQRRSTQWTLGKNVDGSGVLGPITPAAGVGDPAAGWSLRTLVNGEVMQEGSTADMIFSVGAVLSAISAVFTLQPGDLLATGTPKGVGYARTPAVFLQPGDRVDVEIEHLGTAWARVVPGES
ncbi:2-keto-4-pentenoate hydratase/2-oxohepta-3-ene-1,7-dioic acid hydratase in catechol pathway [Streptosporangium becharense]|uniref:2-keto-4-pentenoate hydratase/2-oxohepta-3-ene-1,7-dioic acid hydratase in catechol pathway n=1 Tax=Streptosporangium becharense TaxID=1816182 RepID=A0A7W9IAV2_9ACTN|nr:fumarylacetoacetate hydrolase family protein [Streptosporangium becharense]MBB2910657.1 2-keto-4-pentenoate hydratase/2-oxohepta-3-ene-1,7-dioic acid hydratase in catechol pathway [Streptosporangium becharense]MBB5817352.1 2-keto-4-pentenoate hydratase/2-oxohepta-3-ene-1,7-dioic acid hydratase in catechol pathway [Streptosporangium becharense]